MARYSSLLGQRVEVSYRAADVHLSAAGVLTADSGKSIFLEEHCDLHGSAKTFRWEIPYQCILRVVPAMPASESCSKRSETKPALALTDPLAVSLERQPEKA